MSRIIIDGVEHKLDAAYVESSLEDVVSYLYDWKVQELATKNLENLFAGSIPKSLNELTINQLRQVLVEIKQGIALYD